MFTGLIDDIGSIERVTSSPAGRELTVACSYEDLADGESIALNGVCLTVREREPRRFVVAAAETTLARTNIAAWRRGARVNLERALRLDSRIGGHLVLGHVDAVARVLAARAEGDAWLVDVRLPDAVEDLIVPHGSIAVDGVSLTINSILESGVVQLSIIEYTLRHTTLGTLRAGDAVHVEADVIGKYVRRVAAPYAHAG